ncbi:MULTISPECIES: NAD-dependent epimerase/dehydratase family protein [Luteimonas]|uniref:NAD-dependent dehydratase n=1 Tax=Luteimonas chenhongjianii TaxID=2006110 RepID=A0A290XGB0_9GAMM|nr:MULTISPECIES: NAD-dependent epimerase/dehydratase family protein [Luteimonas]ATD68170.1 NAD-dependent dehydratase [Luteimonas chenhongjianii]RPD88161.1 NAD-dependent epimerase/dehydratase family protein [Luteimonas sp. 100069]
MSKILVLGGDGFCGWPTALHLSYLGHDVVIVDNLSRRRIDAEMGAQSLTPISTIDVRLNAWREVSGNVIRFQYVDIAKDYARLAALVDTERPDAIVHFAEQRSAPYSMRGQVEKRYTMDNNVCGTHNLLVALVEADLDCHVVHLGTMGVYGYYGAGFEIPEGYLKVKVPDDNGALIDREILFPTQPGSVYHLTKSVDQLLFQYYAHNDGVRVTDLHQGVVWGTQTQETRLHPALVNRFDYEGEYGTVLNRFLVQAAIGYPLTVHGTGGQTRAFIHVEDTVRCVELAIANPPQRGDRVKILNQAAETLRVRDLAELVSRFTGAVVNFVPNPREEAAENDLRVSNATFRGLGLDPILLTDALLTETLEISDRYVDRVDRSQIRARSAWNKSRRAALEEPDRSSPAHEARPNDEGEGI